MSRPSLSQKEQLQLSGRIASRRCHGKHLSFLTLLLDDEAPDRTTATAKVAFRRAHFDTPTSSECELPFPIKNSDMPFGALVSVHVVISGMEGEEYQNSYEARSWRLLGEHPRQQAYQRATTNEGAISYSDYLQAREEEFLQIQRKLSKSQESRPPKQPSTRQEQGVAVNDKDRHHGSDPCRARVFADWLVQNRLLQDQSSSRVLDVAGGKGNLSIALAEFGVTCTVVDPLLRSRRSLKKLQKSRSGCDASDLQLPAFVAAYFDNTTATDALVAQYDVLCGMHPDECTECIVDMALKHKKPFAVVPCCVFPSLFSERRLSNGRKVQSYDDFLLYLREKDPHHIEQATLKIQGRNQVIFLSRSTQSIL